MQVKPPRVALTVLMLAIVCGSGRVRRNLRDPHPASRQAVPDPHPDDAERRHQGEHGRDAAHAELQVQAVVLSWGLFV